MLPGHDPSRADRLARNLATQGIEVRRAEEPFKVGNRQLPAGTYLVSHAQPTGRLIRNLLDPETDQPEDFIKRQEERRARRQADQIYDITAWSLPLVYDVELLTSPSAINVRSHHAVDGLRRATTGADVRTSKGRLSDAVGLGGRGIVGRGAATGLRMQSVGGPFTLNGRRYPIGTVVVRVAQNPADLHARLTALATKHGAEIVPTDTTYVESGISLGSNETAFLKAPRVLLAWDTPTLDSLGRLDALHAGATVRSAGDGRSHELARSRELR